MGAKETEDFHLWPKAPLLDPARHQPAPPACQAINNKEQRIIIIIFIICPSANLFIQLGQEVILPKLPKLPRLPSLPPLVKLPSDLVVQIAYCATSGPPPHVRCFYSYKMLSWYSIHLQSKPKRAVHILRHQWPTTPCQMLLQLQNAPADAPLIWHSSSISIKIFVVKCLTPSLLTVPLQPTDK